MYIHDFVSILKLRDRLKLDRRRLEDAHIIYAALNVMNFYPDAFTKDADRHTLTKSSVLLPLGFTSVFQKYIQVCMYNKSTNTHNIFIVTRVYASQG